MITITEDELDWKRECLGPDGLATFYFVLNIAAGRTTFTASTSELVGRLKRTTASRFDELIERLISHELITVEGVDGDPTNDLSVWTILQVPPDFEPIDLTDRKFYIPDSRRPSSWKHL